ncbi:serine hydrolase [Leekyejoonella antrihumi]|uniref:Serine hydrolase n=1 Tax=Leekyejoonella antrihumi TaxID=1660198 RepID=A0A563E4J9_9MICO|nr:serine hydrolase [Leekyejoonella antrihumi]TWP37335.1 serine hydrolase [Leekyejoonella antrihumi]
MAVQWSVFVAPVGAAGSPWISESPADVLRTASIGKMLLLGHVADCITRGSLRADQPITRLEEDFIRDSGLWHVLDQDTLDLADACRLIGAVSDNLATNAVLRTVGLNRVKEYADRLGAAPMELLDKVRTHRDTATAPGAAETLSLASAQSLWRMQVAIHERRVDPMVAQWLSLGTDLSMVASAFDLDPLAHNEIGLTEPLPWSLVNKTGTDDGVRGDTGLVTRDGVTVAYAAVANWTPGAREDPDRATVMTRMRAIGNDIRTRLNS